MPEAPDLRIIRPPAALPRSHSPEAAIQGNFLRVGKCVINLAQVTSFYDAHEGIIVSFGDESYERFEGPDAAALRQFLARHVTEIAMAPQPAPESLARSAAGFPTDADRAEPIRTAWPGFATPRCCREMPMPGDAAIDDAALLAAVEAEAEAIYDAVAGPAIDRAVSRRTDAAGPAADDPAEFPTVREAVLREDFVRPMSSE